MITKGLMAASTRPLILSILSRGKSYGYEIIQQIKDVSGGRLLWSDGMLYPVLHKLESDKLITSEWLMIDERKRKYYSLTSKGREALKNEKAAWFDVHNTLMRMWEMPVMNIEPKLL